MSGAKKKSDGNGVDGMVAVAAALSDPTRLRLLNLMRGGEVCVCYFVEIMDEPQPKISRHLASLREAGLVTARREGKWIHYGISRPSDAQGGELLDAAIGWMERDPAMLRDRDRLVRVCCSPSKPVQLQGAPLPAL